MCLDLCGSLGPVGKHKAAGDDALNNIPCGGALPDILVIVAGLAKASAGARAQKMLKKVCLLLLFVLCY